MRILSGIFFVGIVTIVNYADTKWIPNFFLPEEVQTILQLVYSRLPPTKIGSDKRFGVGFRLGKNADAQILVELGPQSETQPLADAGNGFSKRQSRENLATELHKRRPNAIPKDKKINQTKIANTNINITETDSSETIVTTSRDISLPRHYESFGNIITRWFGWLLQPKGERILRENGAKRTVKSDDKNEDDRRTLRRRNNSQSVQE